MEENESDFRYHNGDGAGIGPEVIIKALADKRIYELARPVVIGDYKIMQRALGIVKSDLQLRVINDVTEAESEYGVIDVVDLNNLPVDLPFSQVSPVAGKAAYEYIERAVQYVQAGKIHAIVTAPLNKEALHAGGKMFPGHTEILAAMSNTKRLFHDVGERKNYGSFT